MCTTGENAVLAQLRTALRDLVEVDLTGASDGFIREALLLTLRAGNQLDALTASLAASFDTRALAEDDGFRSGRAWLSAFGRLTPHRASGVLKRGRILRELPALSTASRQGAVSTEHLAKVVALVDQVGLGPARRCDEILATLAGQASPASVGAACERIRAHADPDGPEPHAGKSFDRRGLSLSRVGDMVSVRGQLDLEGAAAVMTALDALLKPPTPDELRTPAQRRADALVELCRLHLSAGSLPTIGGVRPQIGILITPTTLIGATTNPGPTSTDPTGADPTSPGPASPGPADPTGPDPANPDPDGDPNADAAPASTAGPRGDPLTAAGYPPRPEPAWMDWVGELPTATAQRIACDASLWRVVLDPTTGLPLNLGRAYRTAPPWVRRALHARDRGCRWPGCQAPTQWTDAHHVDHWIHGGPTNVDRMLLLCRWHHARVHEGEWNIHVDHTTGEVTITRPDGSAYELGPSYPYISPTTQAA